MVVQTISQADAIEHFDSYFASLASWDSGSVQQRKLDILHSRGSIQQIEILEDKTQLLVADSCALVA